MIKSCKKPPVYFPTVTGAICSFNSQYAGLPLKSHSVEVVATQSGSGTPSPSNPRSISGYSAIHIQNTCGINQWDEQWRNGYYTTSGQFQSYSSNIATKNKIRVLPNTSYYFKCDGGSFGRVCWYDKDGTFISTAVFQQANVISTSPNNAYYLNFDMVSAYGATYKNDISINYPSTDTSYHAFEGTSATITIGSTVYGGEYDARTGVLTVTSGVITFDGSNDEAWQIFPASGLNQLYVLLSNVETSLSEIKTICDRFKSIKITNRDYNYNTCYTGSTGICFNVENYTIETWKSWLADNPTTVVYELATPQTIQLPPCLIDTLQGENNVWADTGNTTLEYLKAGR